MRIANEIEFEKDICTHLAAHGWLYSPDDTGYDRERALFPADTLAWVRETQPVAWARFETFAGGGAAAEAEFLNRLVKVLAAEGTLHVLRKGFKMAGAGSSGFALTQFRPSFHFNPDIAALYDRMRLRVMRQVHYSTSNRNSIDLVLFVNGLPVATIEVKTDFTQAIEDAKRQYRKDRLPKDAATNREEPLLTFKRGALVHFALSTEEVWMTTRLVGDATYFLPFNRGNDGRAGNAPNPNGYPTAYFWEDILDRDNWLAILADFILVEKQTDTSASGVKETRERIVFPRYHQWDAVTKLVRAARTEGAGHSYLFQHSAGSGKSNTIGWCAHQLSTLHGESDAKVFDSVIVITDRTVLDAQLKDTIGQFGAPPGVVASIESKFGAKSGQLATALKNKALIIVVTIQTFPFVLADIRQDGGLAGKRFAVIIDEAHSSQSGATARGLRGVLAAEGRSEDDLAEVTIEDLLEAELETRVLPPNVSFLAFTATPKAKTIEVFGRPADPTQPKSKTNLPQPFHLYTMRQAIEEGFILDVLQNFMPYRVAYRLAHNGKDWDDGMVDKPDGLKALARWVRLHPYNIAQKVEIVVEHYRNAVAHRLGGKAKAMVVTGSRQEAVRYKLAMDRYIAASGYQNIATIVAFSGDVEDLESGPDKFNEGSMNPGLRGRELREAFAGDDFQVLIVANKFQTGFDQPLLVAMYVDKRLDGITAVQTLSRLNRTYPGKDATFVLDFVNDAETMRLAFEPYYESTELLATTDPNLIYDLETRLSSQQIYTEQEAQHVAEIALRYDLARNTASQRELMAALSAPVNRFKQRWQEAEEAKDKEAIDRLTIFHKDLGSFCRLYDFLSQIVSYEDTTLETSYIFFRHLEPLVRPDRIRLPIDLSGVLLTHHRIKAKESVTIALGTKVAEEKHLYPITAVGTQTARDPEKVKLAELVDKLNDLFVDESLTEADKVGMFQHVAGKMIENEEISKQARANSRAQFTHSPAIAPVLIEAVVAAMGSYQSMGNKVFQDKVAMDRFQSMLVDYVYDQVNASVSSASPP